MKGILFSHLLPGTLLEQRFQSSPPRANIRSFVWIFWNCDAVDGVWDFLNPVFVVIFLSWYGGGAGSSTKEYGGSHSIMSMSTLFV